MRVRTEVQGLPRARIDRPPASEAGFESCANSRPVRPAGPSLGRKSCGRESIDIHIRLLRCEFKVVLADDVVAVEHGAGEVASYGHRPPVPERPPAPCSGPRYGAGRGRACRGSRRPGRRWTVRAANLRDPRRFAGCCFAASCFRLTIRGGSLVRGAAPTGRARRSGTGKRGRTLRRSRRRRPKKARLD